MIDCKPFWTEVKNPLLNLYYQFRNDMKTGDALEWRSNTLFGSLVRLVTRKDVNHTSVLLNLDQVEGCESRRFCMEANTHGVDFNIISSRLADFKGKVYWLPLKTEYDSYRAKIKAFCFLNAGVPYDFKGLLFNLFGRVTANDKKMFCSEFAFLAYKSSGIAAIQKYSKASRPGEIYSLGIHERRKLIFDSSLK